MDTPGRGHGGRFVRTADTAERDAQACELRSRGARLQDIADELGFGDRSAARKAIERALDATVAEDAGALRQLELDRLDRLYRAGLKVLETAHITVSHGAIVRGDDGKPLPDDGPVLQAIDRLVRIADRRAKLLGLDAPAKLEVTQGGDLDAAIAELEAELRARAGSDGVPTE